MKTFYFKFIDESNNERILKIGQHLPKLRRTNIVGLLWLTGKVMNYSTLQPSQVSAPKWIPLATSLQTAHRCWPSWSWTFIGRTVHTLLQLLHFITSANWINSQIHWQTELIICHMPIGDLVVPRVLSRFGCRSFRVSGPTIWNDLPVDFQSSDITREQFKRSLKSWLFECAYSRRRVWENGLTYLLT